VALPAVMVAVLWLGLLQRARAEVPAALRAGGLASCLAVAVLMLAVAWSSIGGRFADSALAHAAPRTLSIRDALDRLWHPPPLDPLTPAGERAVERHMRGEPESLLMATPDLAIEILLRTDRVDRLHLGDAWESSFVAEHELPKLRAEVDALRPGTRMLLDRPGREYLQQLRADPELDTLAPSPSQLAPLQRWALQRIERRYALRPVATAGEFRVVALDPRA
jgi:hypothetical protein